MTTRTRALVASVVIALALTGCGVEAEDSAREIGPSRVPYAGVASPPVAGIQAGSVTERLFMVKDGMLVAVQRRVPTEPTIDQLVRDLLAGPIQTERDSSLTSALLGTNIIADVRAKDTVATVELAAALDETGRTDQILAIAQIVCTLTARPDISGVYFTRDAQRVGVPRADGSLSQGPLTIADYVSLTTGT